MTTPANEALAEELAQLSAEIRRIARRYYDLTGKPLGVTGELAEMEAARVLGLTLAPARQPGWDATRTLPDGTTERIQIKGRWQMNGPRMSGRVGAIDLRHDFDSVYLVLMDAALEVRTIHRRTRAEVEAMLTEEGSRARNERGQLSVGAFVRGAEQVWPVTAPVQTNDASGWLKAVCDALEVPGTLAELCGPKRTGEHNVRERLLEEIVAHALRCSPECLSVQMTPRLAAALEIAGREYPLDTRPDIVFETADGLEIVEVKSGRTDYPRFDCVVGKGMRSYLDAIGESEAQPWEVEQDLLRLFRVLDVSPRVRRAHLILVDAYGGKGRSWTKAFGSAWELAAVARTRTIQAAAPRLVESTSLTYVSDVGIGARMIHCVLERV